MKRSIVIIASLLILSACSAARPDLKSPCVGVENSPCGPHRAVNDWWLKA